MDTDFTLLVDSWLPLIVDFALRILGVLLLFVGGWMVAGALRRLLADRLGRTRLDLTLVRFFSNIASWLMLVLVALSALEVFGVKTTSFAAVIGAAGLAIGLAFQGTLSNFAAGVMLLTFRPFKIGDAVKVAGETGKIDEIDLFMTKMDTFDNRRIFIPNAKIFGSTIETITFHPVRRIDVAVGTDYAADLDQTRAVLEAAVAGIEGHLTDPAPGVFLDGLGDSSVHWVVRVWANTADFGTVRQATIRAVKQGLDAAGIGIPFPQMDVHLEGGRGDA